MAKEVQIILNGKDNASQAFRQVELSAAGVQRKLASMGNELQTFGRSATVTITAPILAAAYGITKLGGDVARVDNLFKAALGSMADEAQAFTDQIRDRFGFDDDDIKRDLSMLQLLFTEMGVGERAALQMGESLVMAGRSMAMLRADGESIPDIMQAIQNAMIGNTRGLRQYGIDLSEAAIKAYAYKNGIAAMGSELTQGQKILAIFGSIMQATATDQERLGESLETPSSRLFIMRQRMQDAAEEAATKLLPAQVAVLTAAEPLVRKIGELAEKFGELSPETQKTVVSLLLAAAAIGPLAAGLGSVIRLAGYGAAAWTKMSGILVAEGQKWMATGMSMGAAAAMVAAEIMVVIGVILIWQKVIQGYSKEWKHLGDDWALTVLNIKRFLLDMLVFVADVLSQATEKFHIFYRAIDPLNLLKLDKKIVGFLDDVIQWSNRQQQKLDQQEIEIGFRLEPEDAPATVDNLLEKYGFDPAKVGEDMKKILRSLLPGLADLGGEFLKSAEDIEKVKADLVDRTMRLTLSERDYQIWALDQEKAYFEKTYAGKKEILDAFAKYYEAKMAEIRREQEIPVSQTYEALRSVEWWQAYQAMMDKQIAEAKEISDIMGGVTPGALAVQMQARGYLAGAFGGDWDPIAFQRSALQNAATQLVTTMLEQGKSWEEIREAIDPLIARFEELNETASVWEELQRTIVADLVERLGSFGKLLEAIKTGNAGNILNALYAAIMDRVPQIADLMDMLIAGFTAILAPIGALLDLIEGLVGVPGLGALAGGGIGYLIGGPIGAALGALAGLLGGFNVERQRRQAEYEQLIREGTYGELTSTIPAQIQAEIERLRDKLKWIWIISFSEAEQIKDEIRDLEEQLAGIQDRIAEILGVAPMDLANAVADAFSAETADEFTSEIESSLLTKVRNAMIRAWAESTAMAPVFEQLSELISNALEDGVMEATELGGIEELIGVIAEAGAEFYNILDELGLGMDDLTDSVRSAADAVDRNVPVIFKRALIEYGVAGPGAAVVSGAGSAPVTIDLRGANIYGVDDLQRIIREAVDASRATAGRASLGMAMAG